MAIVQFRVDDELKNQATDVYERLGLDLSTAIRIFLKRSIAVNGIPFPMAFSKEEYRALDGLQAMREAQEQAEKNGLSDMSLDEINEEIKLARQARKSRK